MKIYAIAKVTFLQIIRQPIFGVLLLLAMGLMTLSPSVTAFTMDDDNQMLQDLCLSTMLMSGLLLAAFGASGAVSSEIEDQTILTIVTKPVNPLAFVLAKFLGVMATLLVACAFMTLTFLMVLRHGVLSTASDSHDWPIVLFALTAVAAAILFAALANYLFDWQFAPTAIAVGLPLLTFAMVLAGFFDEHWRLQPFGTDYSGQVLLACALLLLAVWVLAAICLACSTRLSVVWTMIIAFVVLCGGMIWDSLILKQLRDTGQGLAHLGWSILYPIVPNFQEFWMLDALNAEKTIEPIYLLIAAAYAATYILAMVFLAFALFLGRQVGAAGKV